MSRRIFFAVYIYIGDKSNYICRMRLDRSDREERRFAQFFWWKCYVISYRRRLAKIHKSSWDHKAEAMLLCACIYVRKHFRRSFSSFSFGPMRRSGTEKQRFPCSRRIAGSTRETRFLSVARCLISRYICAVSLCRRAFHVNHALISCMLPSGYSW